MGRKNNSKRGFTLVELIVVLVILAVLAAILVPTLIGYIDKAKTASLIEETNQIKIAAQAMYEKAYGEGHINLNTSSTGFGGLIFNKDNFTYQSFSDSIKELSELKNGAFCYITYSKTQLGNIYSIEYYDGKHGCIYYNGKYYTDNDTNIDGNLKLDIDNKATWESWKKSVISRINTQNTYMRTFLLNIFLE